MFRNLMGAISVGMLLAIPAGAQSWPEQPIRLLVGFGAGGPTDQAARIVAESMTQTLGQPVVVENMPGAGSSIAVRAMLGAPADGYTMVVGTTGFPVAEARYANNEYSNERDFDFIGTISGYPHLLNVPAASPHADMRAFLEAAATADVPPAIGVTSHSSELLVLYLAQQTGVELEFIPYPGQAAIVTDLLAERLDGAILSPSVVQPFIESGDVRALGASTAERFTLMPDVPTFQEGGVEGFTALIWNGLLVRQGTDPVIVSQLSEALRIALENEQAVARLENAGLEPVFTSPEAFRENVLNEVQTWNVVLEAAGVARIE